MTNNLLLTLYFISSESLVSYRYSSHIHNHRCWLVIGPTEARLIISNTNDHRADDISADCNRIVHHS